LNPDEVSRQHALTLWGKVLRQPPAIVNLARYDVAPSLVSKVELALDAAFLPRTFFMIHRFLFCYLSLRGKDIQKS
jgi:hypothetical protein